MRRSEYGVAIRGFGAEWLIVLVTIFVCAGDRPPMVNEAHYLVKAKNFWQPDWCRTDLFAASGKAHTTFYFVFGWPSQFLSLEATAWLGRLAGWSIIAWGLVRLARSLTGSQPGVRWASVLMLLVWVAGVRYGNLAGEWVIGGIEGKVPAYGLVLAALAELIHRRWNRVWVLMGLAAAFHVLTGGWSVIAAAVAWLLTERGRTDRFPLVTRYLWLGGLIALAGVIPSAYLTMSSDAGATAQAARIYAYFRLPHHLLPSQFHPFWCARHGLLIALLIYFAWRPASRPETTTRLLRFVLGSGLIAVCGLAIGVLARAFPDTAAGLLRFYWFRLSDAMIPLGLAVVVCQALRDPDARARLPAKIVCLIAIVLVIGDSVQRMRQTVPQSVRDPLVAWNSELDTEALSRLHQDWLAVCDWVNKSTKPDAVLLTPRHQQTFKWYSQRAEVFNWKDVPQDAASLVQWRKRFFKVFPRRLGTTRTTIHYGELKKLRNEYGAEFLVVDRQVVGRNLPLVRVYPIDSSDNPHYAVYELPR